MDTDLTSWLASVSLFAVSMSGTPGPNNAMVAASGANFGFVRTLPHMLGIAAGFPVMLMAVALGAGGVLRAAPLLHSALKWGGAAYLLWLAFRIAAARPAEAALGGRSARPLGFLQAALFQWVNPKAWIIALGGVATYTTADSGRPVWIQGLLFAGIFLAVSVPCSAFWTMTGVGAARILRTDRRLRRFNLVMAALLVFSLVPLLREF